MLLSVNARSEVPSARRAAILTVAINEVAAGDHIIYLDASDVFVSAELLRQAGLATPMSIVSIDGVAYVALGGLPLNVEIDEDLMTLRLTARPADLPEINYDLGTSRPPSGIKYREATSLYVNYGAHLHERDAYGFAESGLRVGRTLTYSSVSILADQSVVRGLSNVTVDERSTLTRITAGDQMFNGGPLGGGAVIGGVHVIRSFELDPYLITSPRIDLSGSVLAPSTADIYVNGVLVRREQLAPGRYTFANLPVGAGSSDTRVVIRDALGREQDVSREFYTPENLLRPGLSDYHIAAGAVRERMGPTSFDYGTALGIARYRRGITPHVTAGVRADVTPDQGGAGASIALGLPFGQVDAALGVSSQHGTRGVASSLAWTYNSRWGGLSFYAHRVSAAYATIDVPREADRAVTEARVQASLPVSHGLSLGVQLTETEFRDRGWSDRLALTATAEMPRSLVLSVAAGTSKGAQQPRAHDVMVSLGIALGKRTRAAFVHQQRDDLGSTSVAVHRSLGAGPDVGYRVTAEVGDHDRAFGTVQAQTGSGRYELSYAYDAEGGSSTDLSIAGGLALIGGRVFTSTPIDRSFALVRVPGVRGVRVTLENQTLGSTDANGDIFIPNLQPYYGNNIGIEAADLPFDRRLPTSEQVVAPPAGGGVIVAFDSPVLHVVRGTLRVGTRIPAYGELTIVGTPTPFVSPVGSDGEFELDGVAAGQHAASISWEEGRCDFELTIPRSTLVITELGVMHCQASTRSTLR